MGVSGYILSMDRLNSDIDKMIEILQMGKEQYFNMKKECVKMQTFSYQKYVWLMSSFLKKVNERER